MQTDIFCLADAATVNPSAKLNILGTYTALGLRAFPGAFRIVVVFRLVGTLKDVGEHDVEVRVVADGGTLLTASPRTAGHVKESESTPGRVELPGVVVMSPTFPAPGEYSVQLMVNGQRIASCVVHVHDTGSRERQTGEGVEMASSACMG